MRRFDWTIVFGVGVGMAAILGGAWFENLYLGFLWHPTAAMIVCGGTLGAVIVRRGVVGITSAVRAVWSLRLISADEDEHSAERAKLAWLSRTAQKSGIKAFENYANGSNDLLIVNGLIMVADSAKHEQIMQVLQRQLDVEDDRGLQDSATLEA
ncbi:MAG: hypothetical protein ABI878_06345, partial [Acidobacteriota bacterium]